MKLNADIVFDYLTQSLTAEISGRRKEELALSRPLFHMDPKAPFEADKLYVARADKLPARASIREGVVIVVVGESMRLAYYESRCCVIHVTDATDVFSTFNLIQEIFDLFDAYENKIAQITGSTASIQEIVNLSSTLLHTSILVLDAKFNVLAQNPPKAGALLGIEDLETFLANEELMMGRREPIPITILDKSLLTMNLYDHDAYAGSITFDFTTRRRRDSDTALIPIVAHAVITAKRQLPDGNNAQTDVKRALMDLLDGVSVPSELRGQLLRASAGRRFVCLKMLLGAGMAALPSTYICAELEDEHPGSYAFTRDGAVIAVMDVAGKDADDWHEGFERELVGFADAANAHIGMSDEFGNLTDMRLYYDQASAALSGGLTANASERIFKFHDYSLLQLIANAFGDMPIEMYMTAGLRRLVAHDETAAVSYLGTLKAYLDNSMSMTKAASELFVHRSTLIDRIARIERELDLDLANPEDRLRLQIVLKGLEIRSSLDT